MSISHVNVEVQAAGNRESCTLAMKNLKVVDDLNITATKAKICQDGPI